MKESSDKVKNYQFILFYNQAESSLAQEINKFKPEAIDIAYLASKGIIKLRYDKNTITNDQEESFLQNLRDTFTDDIIAYENIDISRILLNLLLEKELTLSFVESVTGGELSARLTKNPGSSNVLKGSSIVYTNEAKKLLLENDTNLKNWPQVTEVLSEKAIQDYASDLNLTILGEAGPISSSKYGIGEIFITISNNEKLVSTTHKLNGNREEIIQRAVNKAYGNLLNLLKACIRTDVLVKFVLSRCFNIN
jgi:nicotinamide-nucleotide amidase